MASTFLTAEWRKLAIANYSVDPKILASYLPYKTELDLWNGKCYISLVGFRFINTRLKGISIPFHRHFEEVNLRFYVRCKDQDGWKRGVTFIKEIVPKRALTFIANTIYKEKYITLPMKHQWQMQKDLISIAYSWKLDQTWNTFSLQADPVPNEIKPNSKEEFITEHYWGYTPINDRSCSEYAVEHPRWTTYNVKEYKVEVAFDKVYNKEFLFLNSQAPESVMLAEGSEIIVRSMKKIV
jgi:uncharacterized protein YqjF (DUF2071 family)